MGRIRIYVPSAQGAQICGAAVRQDHAPGGSDGAAAVYLSTNHTGLYEKYGFEYLTQMTDMDGDPSQTTLETWLKFSFSMLDLAKRMGLE